MKKLSLILFILVTFSCVHSQKSNGYYGARFYTSVESVMNMPLLYNIINKRFEISKYDPLNYGFRMSAGVILRRNLAFSVEAGIDYSNAEIGYYNYYYGTIKIIPKADVRTTVIVPKIEFTGKRGLLPIGVSHQIGFGRSISEIQPKIYSYNILEDDWPYSEVEGGTIDLTNTVMTPVKCYVLMYGLNVRSSITKNILLNYGFRYTANFEKLFWDFSIFEDVLTGGNGGVYNQRHSNFINFNLGLTYVFLKNQNK